MFRLPSWEDTLKAPLRKNCCAWLVIFSLWGCQSIDCVSRTPPGPILGGTQSCVWRGGCAHGDIALGATSEPWLRVQDQNPQMQREEHDATHSANAVINRLI